MNLESGKNRNNISKTWTNAKFIKPVSFLEREGGLYELNQPVSAAVALKNALKQHSYIWNV